MFSSQLYTIGFTFDSDSGGHTISEGVTMLRRGGHTTPFWAGFPGEGSYFSNLDKIVLISAIGLNFFNKVAIYFILCDYIFINNKNKILI